MTLTVDAKEVAMLRAGLAELRRMMPSIESEPAFKAARELVAFDGSQDCNAYLNTPRPQLAS